MANDVAALGLKVDPSGIAEGIKALDDLAARGPKAEKAMDAVGESAAKASKSLKTLGQGAAKGLDDVGQSAPKAADSVGRLSKSAENANSSLSKISTSAAGLGNVATASAQSAKSVESLSASLAQTQKTIAQMQAQLQAASVATANLGKAQSDAARNATGVASAYKAAGQQVSAYARAPEQAAVANQRFAKSMEATGISAKQTAAALRGVPAQFTDIVVSLQSGQAPLTVLLQQGGQLKDMFGGTGAAARALGGYIIGLVNPFTVVAASIAALGVAYYQGSKEADVFRATLAKTGNSAGVTAGVLQNYARQMAETSGTQGKAAETLNLFVAAGVRAQDNLVRFASTAQEWEKATGEGIDAVAQKYVALQKDPLSAAMKLNEGMNFLTVSVYDQIKALEEQGKKTEAAQIAMEALDTAMAQRAKNIQLNLGYIERAWNGIAGAAKRGWDALLDVGRQDTTADKIRKLQEQIEQRMAQPLAVDSDAMRASREKGIANLQRQLEALKALQAQEESGAAADAERLRQVQARAEWDKITAANLDKQAKMEAELTKVREAALQAGISGKELEDQLAAVREKYATKTVASSKATVTAYQSLMVAINESIAASKNELNVGEKLTESQKLRIRYEQELETRERAFTKLQKESIEIALRDAEAAESAATAYKDGLKWKAEWYAAQGKNLEEIKSANDRLREEIKLIGLSQDAQQALERSRIEATLAVREQHLAEMQRANDANQFSSIEQQNLEMEIALLKERLELLDDKRVRTANAEAAKKLEDQWNKTAQTVGDTLADYIMGGGKNAAQYLKRLFSTLVLEPVVQMVVGGIFGGGAGRVAGAGQVQGIGSLFSGNSGLTLGASVGNWLSDTGFTMASGANLGTISNWLGNSMLDLGNTITQWDSTLQAIPGFEGGFGSVLGYGKAIFDLAEGNYGSAVGTAIGTYILPGIGTAIGSVLGGLVDGIFGSNPKEHSGGVYTSSGTRDEGLRSLGLGKHAKGDFTSRRNESIDKALDTTITALLDTYGQLAKSAKGTVKQLDIIAAFATNPVTTSEDAYGYLQIFDKATQELLYKSVRRDGGGLGNDPEKAFSLFTGEIISVMLEELKSADLPAWMSSVFSKLGDNVTLEGFQEALTVINSINIGFASLAATMEMFVGVSDDMKTALLNGLGGIEGLFAAAQTYYDAYYSEQERYQKSLEQMNDVMSGLGVSIDPAMGQAAKEQFRKAVEDALAAGNGELAAALLKIGGAFAELADYAEEASDAVREAGEALRQELIDAAFSSFERSIERTTAAISEQIDIASNAVSEHERLSSAIKSAVDSIRGSVDSTSKMAAARGMVYIENALEQVRRGADIKGFTELEDAISAAQSGINSGAYVTQFDRDREALILAGQLEELGDINDVQLSVEERQLKALKDQLEYYEKLYQSAKDMVDGIDKLADNSLTPEETYAILAKAMIDTSRLGMGDAAYDDYTKRDILSKSNQTYKDQQDRIKEIAKSFEGSGDTKGLWEAIKAAGGNEYDLNALYGWSIEDLRKVIAGIEAPPKKPSEGAVFGPGTPTSSPMNPAQADYNNRSSSAVLGGDAAKTQMDIRNAAKQYEGSGDVKGLWDSVTASGGNQYDLAALYGWNVNDIEKVLKDTGVPGFSQGINVVPRDMLAQIHEGEAIIPKAYNPFNPNAQSFAGSDSALLNEVRSLRQEVAMLRAAADKTAQNTNGVPQLVDQFDEVTEGGNILRVEVIA